MSLFLPQVRNFYTGNRAIPNVFPGNVVAEVTFGPDDAFGVPAEPRTTLGKGQATTTYLAEEGGLLIGGVMIERIQTEIRNNSITANFNGNLLTLTFFATSLSEARKTLSSLNQVLVPITSHHLRTYVWIKGFKVRLGDERFDFILAGGARPVVITTAEDNSARLIKSVSQWLAVRNEHVPFYNALHYYRQAQRLACLQPCPEPMVSEIVLNLAKVIEVLFQSGGNRNKIREQAKVWGLDDEEIEELIIPIMLLRRGLDVAHPALSPLQFSDRQTVMEFAIEALNNMESLLHRMWDGILANKISLPAPRPLEKEKADLLRSINEYLARSRKRKQQGK